MWPQELAFLGPAIASHSTAESTGKGSTMANQYKSELLEQRKVAEKLLARGQVTVAEIAAHFGLARQTVAVWAREIDVSAARSAWIARQVEKASK